MSSVQTFQVEYLKGMDEALVPSPDSASLVVNARQDHTWAWRPSGSFTKSLDDQLYEGQVKSPWEQQSVEDVRSVAWFSQQNGSRQWLVCEVYNGSSRDLVYVDHSGPYIRDISTGREHTDGVEQSTQYISRGGWLYAVNGRDEPVRWNGEYVNRIGFSGPAQAPAVFGPKQGFNERDLSLYHRPEMWQGFHDVAGWSGICPTLEGGGAAATYSSTVAVSGYPRDVQQDLLENQPGQRGIGTRAANYSSSGEAWSASSRREWRYGYKVTWVNDLGQESPASAAVYVSGFNTGRDLDLYSRIGNRDTENLGDTGGGRRMVMISIPDAPPWVRGMKLYRTANGAPENPSFYLHTEFTSCVGTVIVDDKPDDELGYPLDDDTLGAFPVGASMIAEWQGRVWVANSPEYPDRVFYSDATHPEQFPFVNNFSFGSQRGGHCTGIAPAGTALVVFQRRGIHIIRPNGTSYQFDTITTDYGGVSPNAIVQVPGRGLLFLSEDGPRLLVGAVDNTGIPSQVDPTFGRNVRRTWNRRVTKSALVGAWAVHNAQDKEVWIHVPVDGDDRPNYGFIYHYETDQWSTRAKGDYPFRCAVVSGDYPRHLFAGTYKSDDDAGIVVYLPDGTPPSSASYQSARIDFGNLFTRTNVKGVELLVEGYGAGRTLTMDWRKDDADSWNSYNATHSQTDKETTTEVIGTAVFGASLLWRDTRHNPYRFDIGGPPFPTGQVFQWRLDWSKGALVSSGIDVEGKASPTEVRRLVDAVSNGGR